MAEHGSPNSRGAHRKERIREVLAALGGSVEPTDRADEPSTEELPLALRIDAYTSLQSPPRAPRPAMGDDGADPTAEPIPKSVEPEQTHFVPEARPSPGRARATAAVPHMRRGGFAVRHVAETVVFVLARGVLAGARALRGLAAALVLAAPDVAKLVVRAASVAFAAALRAGRAGIVLLPSLPRVARRGLRLGLTPFTKPSAGVPLLAAAVAVIAGLTLTGTLGHDGGGSHPRSNRAAPSRIAPQPVQVPPRDSFDDPRAYAAALTRLALIARRTTLDGAPACAAHGTWDHWTCRTRGKPSLGAHAGHWLTYRCSPRNVTQAGRGAALLTVDCRPVNPGAAERAG